VEWERSNWICRGEHAFRILDAAAAAAASEIATDSDSDPDQT